MTAFLAKIGRGNIAELVGPLLAPLTYVTDDFCTADAPADPGLTAQDLIDVINYAEPQVQIPALQKFEQWFGAQFWGQICHCDTGSAYTPPTPSDPGGAGTNTGIPDAQVGGNCWDQSQTQSSSAPNTPLTWAGIFPSVPHQGSGSAFTGEVGIQTPAPASVTITLSCDSAGSNPLGMDLQLVFYNSSNTVISGGNSITNATPGGPSKSFNVPIPATAANWAVGTENTVGSSSVATNNVTVEATIYCSGQSPTGVTAACCPPDPNLDQKLNQIIGMVTAIYSIIPVRVPNYAGGTAHSGLSGASSLSLASTTIALKVVFDSLPTVYGEESGSPNTYFDIGWITPVNNEGPEGGMRLTRQTQIIALPDASSAIDYTFPSGASVTITELQAG